MSEQNLLAKHAALRLESPLELVISEREVSDGEHQEEKVLFSGEVTEPSPKGKIISAKVVSGGTIFDRKVPKVLYQRGCNNCLFDASCQGPEKITAPEKWKWTATVQDAGEPGYPFEFVLEGLARDEGDEPTYSENYFANGVIQFGSGVTICTRPIGRSTAPIGGVMTVKLSSSDPEPFPVAGEQVFLWPGCAGRYEEDCGNKFGNQLNFIGQPFLPFANPSLVKPSQGAGTGKK